MVFWETTLTTWCIGCDNDALAFAVRYELRLREVGVQPCREKASADIIVQHLRDVLTRPD